MPDPSDDPAAPPATGRPGGPRRSTGRRRSGGRRVRWLRWLLVAAACLGALGLVTLFVLTRPSVLTPFLQTQIQAIAQVETRLDRASLSFGGVLRLEGLSLRLPPGPDPREPEFSELLEVERVTLRVGRRELLLGRIDLRRIEVEGPTLHGVLDGRDGQTNLQAWAGRLFQGDGPPGEPGPVRLPPAIEVRDALLDLRQLHGEPNAEENVRRQLSFHGKVVPRGSGADAEIAFELRGGDDPSGGDPTLVGRWAPGDRSLVVKIERVDLASPLGLLMPPAARAYWRELAPAGDLPSLTVETQLDRSGAEAVRRARLEVRNLSFRLPLASLGLLPEGERAEDAPRMTGVTGEVVVEDGRLHTSGVVGEVDGIRARLSGFTALQRGGDVGIVFETDAFDVPADPPFLFRLPGLISQIYSEYRPSGRFSARVEVARSAGKPIEVGGRLRAIDARAVFHGFAFPLEKLQGDLAFSRNRLELRSLAAHGPEGGRVVLDGWITDPGPDAGMDLAIRTTAVPVNDVLLGALEDDLRETVGNFFSTEAAERVVQVGPGTPDAAAFVPGGLLNGTVRVLRDLAVRPRSWIELDLDPEGLQVMMPAFAYPLTIRSGALQLRPDGMRVNEVVATGVTGGAGVISGRIDFPSDGAPPAVQLRLEQVSLPVDDVLLAALDPEAARWLRRLGLEGRVTGRGLIGGPPPPGGPPEGAPENRLGLALDLRVDGARLGLWGGEAPLQAVSAEVRVGRDAVRIDRVAAEWPGGGRLFADGRIDLPSGRLRLDLEADRLPIDDRLALLIPPEVAARDTVAGLIREHELGGLTDATVLLRTGLADEETPHPDPDPDSHPDPDAPREASPSLSTPLELTWSVRARPGELSGVYGGRPVRLEGVSGLVDFSESAAELRGLSGRNGPARMRVSGVVPYDPGVPTDLSIAGSGDTANPLVQAFLPVPVREALEAAAMDAGFRLAGARLRLGPASDTPDPARPLPFDFSGRIDLTDLQASLGMAVTRGEGVVEVQARGGGPRPWPAIRVEATEARLRYANRLVEQVGFVADNDQRPSVIAVRSLEGAVSGGRLSGGGAIRLGDDAAFGGPPPGAGSYRLDVTVEGALAEPVLFPEPPEGSDGGGQGGGEGEASAADRSGSRSSRPAPLAPRGTLRPPGPPPPAGGRGVTSPPERRGPSPGGRLWASLTAEGRAGDARSLTGRGEVRIRGGDLLREQSGVALLRAINLGLPTDAPLGDADANLVLSDNRIRVRDASLRGPGLSLTGNGWVELATGRLYLALFSSRDTNVLFRGLQRVFDTIKDEFIGIEVIGTVWEPEARVSSLAALRGEVHEQIGATSAPLRVPLQEPAPTPAAEPSDAGLTTPSRR